MKVLFWMNNGFDTHFTSEHLLTAVIEQLALAGNQVHVLQLHQKGNLPLLPERLVKLGVSTEAVGNREPGKSNLVGRYFSAVRYCLNCRAALKRQRDAEAVFLQSTTVAWVSAGLARKYLKKARITFNVQDIFPYNAIYSGQLGRGSVVFKLLARLQRKGYRKADRIITVSEDMKELLVEDGTPSNKIEVVYNWSYQDAPYKNLDLQKVGRMFNPDEFNVVYAGNIGVMQNVALLIEAAKLLKDEPDVHFHIIGDGVQKEKLEAEVQRCGLKNVSFWPMQPSELAPYIYSAANVNVIPLIKDGFRTALPSKTATCIACGQPIVFALGKESRFAKQMERAGYASVESDRAEELAATIRLLQKEMSTPDFDSFFRLHFSITKNSCRYAEVITGVDLDD